MAKRRGSERRPVGGSESKSAKARRKELSDRWRQAMRGDQQALESLLSLAIVFDKTSKEGNAARRLVSRAYLHHARVLISKAETSAAAESDALRQKAHSYFYKAVLAKHLELPSPADACAKSAQGLTPASTMPPSTRSSGLSLFDPPPDPPTNVIAAFDAPTSSVEVQWTAPDNNGGKMITGYEVIPEKPGAGAVLVTGLSASVPFPPTDAGNTYTFTVNAINADGKSLSSLPSNPVTIGSAPPIAIAPTDLMARVIGAAIVVNWKVPSSTSAIRNYDITAYDQSHMPQPPKKKTVAGDTTTVFSDLLPGLIYRFGIRAFNTGGFGPETLSPLPGLIFPPPPDLFKPEGLPSFPISSLLFLEAGKNGLDPLQAQRRLTGALAQANKWRFEYLKEQAVKAAKDALQYEQHIAWLMQMALTKVSTAELLLSPVLQHALEGIKDAAQAVKGLGLSDEVGAVIKQVGDAAANALALEALILFLIHEPDIGFWVGLFGAMIDDVAHFDADLNNTKGFLRSYLTEIGSPGLNIVAAVHNLKDQIGNEVERMAAPLKHAVADVIRGTTAGMEEVYQSFDSPLLASATKDGAVVLNPPPQYVPGLGDVLNYLQKTLDDLIAKLKKQISDLIETNPLDLVINLIITFICLPILAALVISFIAGPIAAAILAAIVVIAAVELIRLVLRLLTGPLLGILEDAKNKVLDALGQLERHFQSTANLLEDTKPELHLIASNLLEMKSLLPEAFLSDAAALLGEARRALLENTTELALAAERALGMENATAFDVISTNYNTGLTPAPQMPGGEDATLLAGAAMLRDLNLLERQRVRVLDGKEMLVTQRLSLFRLLGGDPTSVTTPGIFSSVFLKNGKILVHLDEATLLDQGYPGLYRALISEIRPIGVFTAAASASGLPVSIPLTITHTGPSRTRVKRDANPDAPPLMPDCLKLDQKGFVDQALGTKYDDKGTRVGDELDRIWELLVEQVVKSYKDPVWRFDHFAPPSITQQVTDMLLDGVHYVDAAGAPKFMKGLPDAFATWMSRASCGLIDLAAIAQKTREHLLKGLADGGPLPEPRIVGTGTPTNPIGQVYPNRGDVRNAISNRGIVDKVRGDLAKIASDSYAAAIRYYGPRVAKWAGATFEEDRDLHIRSLGFVTLVQSFEPESAVFNLLADTVIPTGKPSATPHLAEAQAPVSPASTLQYRPFENRGLGCDLLLNLGKTVGPDTLIDLLLEITVRACFDEDLAAAVKSSRVQSLGQLERAKEVAVLALASKSLIMPSALSIVNQAPTSLRTFNLSLRAHRDNLLQMAYAAAEASKSSKGSVTVDGLKFNWGTDMPLKAGEPLQGLSDTLLSEITLQFQNLSDKPTLGALAGMIPITPESFGTALSELTSTVGELVSVGLAVIPTPPATIKSLEDAWKVDLSSDMNRNTVKMKSVKMDPLITRLLPQIPSDPAHPKFEETMKKRLLMTVAPPAQPVKWKEIWEKASSLVSDERPHLTIDFGSAITNGLIYDVIFSLSFRNQVTATTIGPNAI